MNISEAELIKVNGWSKADLRRVREDASEFEGHKLWYTDNENKPKMFQKIFWTSIGVIYLQEYFKAKEQLLKQSDEGIASEIIQDGAMTKSQFAITVNNTRWIGKVVRNSYKNAKLVLVEHETGFNVIATCKDNILYPRNQWVIVDTLNNKHSIRKPAFKLYEQAKKQKI